MLLARQLSLALLIIVLAEHGHMRVDQSGVYSGTTGLARALERDLTAARNCRDLERKIVQNTRIRIGDPHVEHRTDRIHIGTGTADH